MGTCWSSILGDCICLWYIWWFWQMLVKYHPSDNSNILGPVIIQMLWMSLMGISLQLQTQDQICNKCLKMFMIQSFWHQKPFNFENTSFAGSFVMRDIALLSGLIVVWYIWNILLSGAVLLYIAIYILLYCWVGQGNHDCVRFADRGFKHGQNLQHNFLSTLLSVLEG